MFQQVYPRTEPRMTLSRRAFLGTSALLASAIASGGAAAFSDLATQPASQPTRNHRYKIAGCDWIMLKRQTNGAITRARESNLDGVEVDMGPLSKNPTFDNKFLNQPGFTEKYLDDCRTNGIEISSVAMSGYYAQSFPERPYEQPLKDCIATCKLLGVKTAFLPLGVYGDVSKRPWHYATIVERLKRVGEWAEEAGVTIGVETALPAEGDCHFLDEIGSKGIRIYFNFQNAVRGGRDLCKELQTLGKERIVQIHPTNDDVVWLQDDPAIDMRAVKKCLDDMGWSGWLVIERSRSQKVGGRTGEQVVKNFSANAAYLKSIFQA